MVCVRVTNITGKKSPLLQAAARRLSFSPRDQLPNHGLRAGDKYYWEMVPATSSISLAPQLFAVESAAWPGSGGRRQVLLEDDHQHFKQQPGALVLCRGISCPDCGDKSCWKQATATSRYCWLPQARYRVISSEKSMILISCSLYVGS